MRIVIALVVSLVFVAQAHSAPSDYSKFFTIDLEAPLPKYEYLVKKYITDDPDHDRRYEHNFLIGETFDEIFRQTAKIYGSSEKRMKPVEEELFIEMLNSVPKETWQYIGPYLHTIAGMSPKILNMPGIKETKNKFPTRIAPQLKDMENLEFLSPHMYYILMPEVWPSNYEHKEIVRHKQKVYHPNTKVDPKHFEKILALAPREEYTDPEYRNKVTKKDLRTTNITPQSPLTSGDVKAFAQSLPSINAYINKNMRQNLSEISHAGALLDIYEADMGTALPINNLKDVVNPCQREVQKIIVAGKYKEFANVVAPSGFSPETWAVTCDKTIRAFRVATMHLNSIIALKSYKNGVYDKYIANNLTPRNQQYQFATLQSIIEMHKSSVGNIMAVKKYVYLLRKEFLKSDNMMISSPIVY